MIRRFSWLVFVAAITTAVAAQQAPLVPNGVILGKVLDVASKKPIAGVLVEIGPGPDTLYPGTTPPPRVRTLTDTQGRFVFRQLLPGTYAISATTGSNGFEQSGFLVTGLGHLTAPYLNGGFGQRRPNGPLQNLALEQGAVVADAVITLWRGASIDGTVVDEANEPLVGAIVAAVRRTSDGVLTTGPTTRTDDRGMYHFSALAPGEYVVVVPQTQVLLPASAADAPPEAPVVTNALVMPSGPARHVYVSTFHPESTSLGDAKVITVRSGDEVKGVDVQLSPMPAVPVSGTLVDAGVPVPNFGVRLLPVDLGNGAEVMDLAVAATDVTGRFTFPLVPAGQYRLLAQRESGTVAETAGAWAEGTVTVGTSPVNDVVLTVNAGYRVLGQVVFKGVAAPPGRDRVGQVTFTAVPARAQRRHSPPLFGSQIDAEDRIAIAGLSPGRYILNWPESLAGWSVESVKVGQRDLTDNAFEIVDSDVSGLVITFTDQPASIAGTVRSAPGKTDLDTAVYLLPADRTRWRDAAATTKVVRTVRADSTGRFVFSNVIPGDYLLAAIAESQAYDWPDQKLLTRLGAVASRVRALPRQQTSVALTTTLVK